MIYAPKWLRKSKGLLTTTHGWVNLPIQSKKRTNNGLKFKASDKRGAD